MKYLFFLLACIPIWLSAQTTQIQFEKGKARIIQYQTEDITGAYTATPLMDSIEYTRYLSAKAAQSYDKAGKALSDYNKYMIEGNEWRKLNDNYFIERAVQARKDSIFTGNWQINLYDGTELKLECLNGTHLRFDGANLFRFVPYSNRKVEVQDLTTNKWYVVDRVRFNVYRSPAGEREWIRLIKIN